mmetsp:Transcript_20604/g.57461  ORF Transcript_20604/g.57461 Transcript_20604/m.57461 type:complete len:248 (-) Transcript_20604:169-912(-)
MTGEGDAALAVAAAAAAGQKRHGWVYLLAQCCPAPWVTEAFLKQAPRLWPHQMHAACGVQRAAAAAGVRWPRSHPAGVPSCCGWSSWGASLQASLQASPLDAESHQGPTAVAAPPPGILLQPQLAVPEDTALCACYFGQRSLESKNGKKTGGWDYKQPVILLTREGGAVSSGPCSRCLWGDSMDLWLLAWAWKSQEEVAVLLGTFSEIEDELVSLGRGCGNAKRIRSASHQRLAPQVPGGRAGSDAP